MLWLIAAVVGGAWFFFASYDCRNVLPALLVISICVPAGCVRFYRKLERWRTAQMVLLGIITLLGVSVVSQIYRVAAAEAAESLSSDKFNRRIRAGQSDLPEKIKDFFPDEYETWNTLSHLHLLQSANHVLAGSVMYRWHPGGIYPYCDDVSVRFNPGDLFISTAYLPQDKENWTMVHAGRLQTWVRETARKTVPLSSLLLTGATPPRLLCRTPDVLGVETNGNQSLIVYNVANRELTSGFCLTWYVTWKERPRRRRFNPTSWFTIPAFWTPRPVP